MKTLDLCQFPLDSLSLIEASAGTGKTYAVANLYLRYLLEKKLNVEEILVVTFTEAATQELRDRIRARIQDLYHVFSGLESEDEVLNYLYLNSEDREADKLRLRISERQIDQAEIHTIHGFCQQLLVRYALDLNVPFNQNLVEDSKPLLLSVCEDFWRTKILKLPRELLLEVYSYWACPEDLLDSLEPMINRRPEICNPEIKEGGLIAWESHYQKVLAWYIELREAMLENFEEVRDVIAASNLKSVKKKLEWLESIRAWCETEALDFNFPKTSTRKNLFQVFIPDSLSAETKKNASSPDHHFFSFLKEHLEKQPKASREVFLVQSYQEISDKLKAEKEAQSAVSFDDLILSVSDALKTDPTRSLLINSVRERFSVALIDEFQDTDREQYHIFSSIFASSIDGKPDASMTLIGDPKQAIYAFRGGDIATYLRAKQDITLHERGQLFTMDTNWRSSPEMVDSVNQVFLKSNNAFMADAIPFFPVKAARQTPENLKKQPALNISLLQSGGRSKQELDALLANCSVQKIIDLLKQGKVNASDIAVLVRSFKEAELIKARLSTYGLGASYEGKSNIYDSDEAQAIYRLLEAMAEPTNEYLILHCLSDSFFCIDDDHFLEIRKNDEALEQYLDLFNKLNACWVRYGVLAAIRKAMSDLGVFSSWQSDGESEETQEWERRLTNVNQLAELLQNKSQKLRGHFALLRWFRQNIVASSQADDESRLRLESDEPLIRIVTIHKSKGLEYPYVFLPFLSSARGADLAWFYDQSGRLNLDLLKMDSNSSLVERERLAEDIRLLYVALTRAKYQCYIGTVFYKGRGLSLGIPQTAWAYSIARNQIADGMDEEGYRQSLESLANESGGNISLTLFDEESLKSNLSILPSSQISQGFNEQKLDESHKYSCAILERSLVDSWRVQSFTGLMQESHSRSLSRLPSVKQSDKPPISAVEFKPNIYDFPRGSKAGTFLHTLFESIEFKRARPLTKRSVEGKAISLKEMVSEQLGLSRLVEEGQLNQWADFLSDWLIRIVNFPLHEGFSLSCLSPNEYQAEMEFVFKVKQCKLKRFNEIVSEYMHVQPLAFSSFEGHLKGAIDLVFVEDGKFYLLDYKSNYLGEAPSDYCPEKLKEAMLDHRYDLQYLIYSIALHRYLESRLGDSYSYEQNFGGVYYLYLRGMQISDEDDTHNGVYFVKPDAELIYSLNEHLESGV